jgi:hypothetical protein
LKTRQVVSSEHNLQPCDPVFPFKTGHDKL